MPDTVWSGAPDLEQHLVPVADLEPFPGNPNRGRILEISESLARWGQTRPILKRAGRIIAGNHTYRAVVKLGWTHIAAIEGAFASEEEARAYLVADNQLPRRGTYDDAQLLSLLEEVERAGTWAGTGYSSDDLRALQDQVPTTAPEAFTGGYAATPEEIAARQAALAGGNAMRELPLMLSNEQAAQLERYVKILRKEYAVEGGVTEVIYRAVAEASGRA